MWPRARASSRRGAGTRRRRSRGPPRAAQAEAPRRRRSAPIALAPVRSAIVRATRSARSQPRPLRPSGGGRSAGLPRPPRRAGQCGRARGVIAALRRPGPSRWSCRSRARPTALADRSPSPRRVAGESVGGRLLDARARRRSGRRARRSASPRSGATCVGRAVRSRRSPSPCPQGHGLEAATSWKRHGSVSVARGPGDRHPAVLERLAQGLERRSRRNSASSSRKSTPRWARVISPGRGGDPPPTSARGGDRVVRGAEGPPASPGAGPGQAGGAGDPGHLDRLGALERRQDRGQPPARRATCPRRAGRRSAGCGRRRRRPRGPCGAPGWPRRSREVGQRRRLERLGAGRRLLGSGSHRRPAAAGRASREAERDDVRSRRPARPRRALAAGTARPRSPHPWARSAIASAPGTGRIEPSSASSPASDH